MSIIGMGLEFLQRASTTLKLDFKGVVHLLRKGSLLGGREVISEL